MDPPGFEPGASALQGRRSPSLSYGPIQNIIKYWFFSSSGIVSSHLKLNNIARQTIYKIYCV